MRSTEKSQPISYLLLSVIRLKIFTRIHVSSWPSRLCLKIEYIQVKTYAHTFFRTLICVYLYLRHGDEMFVHRQTDTHNSHARIIVIYQIAVQTLARRIWFCKR